LHQVGTSSLLIYMMHGHTYIKQFYYFYLLSVASHLYIGGKTEGQVLIPGARHGLYHPNQR